MQSLGLLLQFVGLTIPPVAMIYQLTSDDKHSLMIMLGLAVFAMALFWLGTILRGQRRA